MSQDLSRWFSDRPQWLQVAATKLIENSVLHDQDIDELATICRQEVSGALPKKTHSFPENAFPQGEAGTLRLCSISDIEGVNALAPRKPLEFGTSNITIVYGTEKSATFIVMFISWTHLSDKQLALSLSKMA